jgi:hypothetical protein
MSTADSGPGTLRQAILDANAAPGRDTIAFAIADGARTIRPTSALPAILDPVTIDGTTQPEFAGRPIIELDGSVAGTASGLVLDAPGNTVRGLVINRFSAHGIYIRNEDFFEALATPHGSDLIAGNYIGTDLTGTIGRGNGMDGIAIFRASNNVIGGTAPSDRNVISGNGLNGIRMQGGSIPGPIPGTMSFYSGADGNTVLGNVIGVDAALTRPLGNAFNGVLISQGAGNTIGGTAPGAGNIIAFNHLAGILALGDSGTVIRSNIVAGNAGVLTVQAAALTTIRRRTLAVVAFSDSPDPAPASNPANYLLVAPGRDRRFGTRDDVALAVVSAQYRPGSNFVTLATHQRLRRRGSYALVVRGTPPGGLTREGLLLDGDGDGLPGGDFLGLIGR